MLLEDPPKRSLFSKFCTALKSELPILTTHTQFATVIFVFSAISSCFYCQKAQKGDSYPSRPSKPTF
jgi:hypothetical protein